MRDILKIFRHAPIANSDHFNLRRCAVLSD